MTGGKGFPNNERLGQAARLGLFGLGNRKAELFPASLQVFEAGQVLRCGDNPDFPDTRHHQDGKRVVDHWLVVYRQKLLAHYPGYRVQASPVTPGQDYSFHLFPLCIYIRK